MRTINDILKHPGGGLKPTAGMLLLSEPLLDDFFFGRSVVLLAEHNTDGSFGIIVNKPTKFKLGEVIQDAAELKMPVYMGGPVNPDSLFFIHTRPDLLGDSVKISEGLYWGGPFDEARKLLNMGIITENMIRFFIGYSGWSPEQLEQELERESWVVAKTAPEEVMNTPADSFWKNKIKSLGRAYELWLNFPTNPELN